MASKRCLPVRFFKDPDVMNLNNREHQLVLIGLVLAADDEGRELAHAQLLGREIDCPPELIEAALQDLVTNDLIILYQVGKHRCYSLTQWNKWQAINPNRMTPSRYPAPPGHESQLITREVQVIAGEVQQHAGKMQDVSGEIPAQVNVSQFNVSEGEEKGIPTNITPFPTTAHTNDTTTDVQAHIQTTTRELALILKLPICHALTRLVTTYVHDQTVSLLTEADAAREWIEDRQRNRTGKPMSISFFRTWIKREHNEAQDRRAQRHQKATGTDGTTSSPTAETSRSGNAAVAKYGSLMELETHYRSTQMQKGKP